MSYYCHGNDVVWDGKGNMNKYNINMAQKMRVNDWKSIIFLNILDIKHDNFSENPFSVNTGLTMFFFNAGEMWKILARWLWTVWKT